MNLIWQPERVTELILPTAAEVSKYGESNAPKDDEFLTENSRGLPVVKNPVGKRDYPELEGILHPTNLAIRDALV